MIINGNKERYAEATLLFGSNYHTWGDELISMLHDNVPVYDPSRFGRDARKSCQEVCRTLVFVITPEAMCTRSGFYIGTMCQENPARFILCKYGDGFTNDQASDLETIASAIEMMGGTFCNSLEEVAALLNAAY